MQFGQCHLRIGLKGKAPSLWIIVEHSLEYRLNHGIRLAGGVPHQNVVSIEIGPVFDRLGHDLNRRRDALLFSR